MPAMKYSDMPLRNGDRIVWCLMFFVSACLVERRADEIIAEHGITWEPDTTTTSASSGGSSTGSTALPPGTSTETGGGSMGQEEGTEGSSTTGTTGVVSGGTTGLESGGTTGGAECGNGVVEEGESCDDGNADGTDGCKDCVRESLVFVSSEYFQGKDFNGLFGADQWCRSLAAKAGLRRFETFKAWLSTTEESAEGRLIHSEGRYVLVNGLVVANGWKELVSGTLQRPIEVTEKSETRHWPVWTGTLPDGTTAGGSTQCDGWTVIGSKEAGRGSSAYKDEFWTFIEHGDCGSENSIYCVEQ